MFKKVVLSGLLSGAMVFSMGVNVRAEGNKDVKTCKQTCYLMKGHERQILEKLRKMKKEIDAATIRKLKIDKEYADNVIPFVGRTNFEENENRLKLLHDFRSAFEDDEIQSIEKTMELIENLTTSEWKKYNEACPNIKCQGKYNEKDNSSVTQNNFSWGYLKNLTSLYWNSFKSLLTKSPIKKVESEFAKAEKAKHRAEEEFERAHYDVNKAEDNLRYVRNAEEAACIDSEMENKNQVCARLKREFYNAQKMLDAAKKNLRVAEIKCMDAHHYAKEKEEELKAIRAKAESCGENEFYNANTNTCGCIAGYVNVNGKCRAKIACGENEVYNTNTNTCECKAGYVNVNDKCMTKVACGENEAYNENNNICKDRFARNVDGSCAVKV